MAWVGFIADHLLFGSTASEDAAVCPVPGGDLCTSAVLWCSLLPTDEWEKAHMDVPCVWQTSTLWPAHNWWVSTYTSLSSTPFFSLLSVASCLLVCASDWSSPQNKVGSLFCWCIILWLNCLGVLEQDFTVCLPFLIFGWHWSVLRIKRLLPHSFHQADEPAQLAALVDWYHAAWNKPLYKHPIRWFLIGSIILFCWWCEVLISSQAVLGML